MLNADISTESPYRQIPLSRGKFALVDADMCDFLNQWKWFCQKDKNTFYATRSEYLGGGRKNPIRKSTIMHRIILNAPNGVQIDHINGDGLCNIRSNLRLATPGQNARNQHIRANGTSKYKGVSWCNRDKIWVAHIGLNGKRIRLGCFTSETEAALAYNRAALQYHGEFARVNIL